MHSEVLLLLLLLVAEMLSVPQNDYEVAHLCPGEHHSIVCNTNQTHLRWTIEFPLYGPGQYHQQIYVSLSVGNYYWGRVGSRDTSTTINYTKKSEPEVLPLISTLIINFVTAIINGTTIGCYEEVRDGDSYVYHLKSTTVIHVINSSAPPKFGVIISETFEVSNITIIMEWTQTRDDVWYNVSTEPQLDLVFTGNARIQLIALYNTLYNVSIIASSALCNTGTFRFDFKYASCGDPVSDSVDEALRIIGYKAPILEGSSIKLDCFPGYTFIGPNSSTCTGNGEWEPDPREVECEANCGPPRGYIFPYNSTVEGSIVEFVCQGPAGGNLLTTLTAVCNNRGNWDPNPATVCESGCRTSQNGALLPSAVIGSGIMYILSLAIACMCGLLCGHRTRRHEKSWTNATLHEGNEQVHPQPPRHPAPVYEHVEQPTRVKPNDASQDDLSINTATSGKAEQARTSPVGHPAPPPVYEDVLPVHGEAKKNVIEEIKLQDLEMNKNVAYGPI